MNEFKRIPRKDEIKERKKKILLTGISVCIVLIIILATMIIYYRNKDAKTFKIFVNNVQQTYSQGFYFTSKDGKTYVRAKDIAKYIGWSYQNSEYDNPYSEENSSGYISNEYEASSFVANSNIIKKYINVTAQTYTDENGEEVKPYETNSDDNTLETSTISSNIIQDSQTGDLYFPLENLPDICLCKVIYENPYRMYLYNQDYLITTAQTNAAQFGYKSISGLYENMRLLPYDRMVVSNGTLYGVVGLYDGKSEIGFKYEDMIFAQNNKEFFVKAKSNDEETVGIINFDGSQIIQPKNYSNIQVLSDELGLYLVEKDEKYGVLNRSGNVIVHCEYDKVGLPDELADEFETDYKKSKYLLYNNTIIVESSDGYGLYSINGNQTLKTAYKGFGYVVSEDEDAPKNSENTLTIEFENLNLADGTTRNVQAIILKQDVDDVLKYGVYDTVSGKEILPCIYDRIYTITTKGQTEYYIDFQGKTVKFSDQLANNPGIFED